MNDDLNPLPIMVIHLAISAICGIGISHFLRNRVLAATMGMVLAILASVLWRPISFNSERYWDDFIVDPLLCIIRGEFLSPALVEENIFGITFNWFIATVFGYIAICAWQRIKRHVLNKEEKLG